MHIPDGFLDIRTVVAGGVLSASGLGYALRQIRLKLPSRDVPLIGLAAAFIFVAQMLNFPVIGGTSGHLIGAVLAAVLLGPAAAVVVMSSVLVLQCLFFADGGLLALGANILNMAIVGCLIGYAAYRLVCRLLPGLRGQLVGTAFGSWCSVVAASISCAGQLALSGTVAWRVAFPAMASIHMLIGFGEAAISTLVVAAVARTRPELLPRPGGDSKTADVRPVIVFGLIVCAALAIFVAPFASPWPDGLERVATSLGFEHKAFTQQLHPAPAPDYVLPGIPSTAAATALAGIAGTVIAFLFAFFLARILSPRTTSSAGARDLR